MDSLGGFLFIAAIIGLSWLLIDWAFSDDDKDKDDHDKPDGMI